MSAELTKKSSSSLSTSTVSALIPRKVNWSLLAWLLGPIVVRLLLMPLNNQWDIQTWYSMFADFKFGHSPYDTMRTLSYETRAENIGLYYEYFAYPPGLIYIYWPIAKIYALLDPNLNYSMVQAYSLAASPAPWYFNYFFKVPIMLADLGVVALLWKMGGREVAKRYTWSPYIIMVAVWMFDPFMVLTLLWAVYALERKRTNQAAFALALGTLIKYVPMFIFPAIVLYLVRQGYSFFQIVRFCLLYIIVCAIAIAPFVQGTLFCFQFQTDRVATGLTWENTLNLFVGLLPGFTPTTATSFSAWLGALILPIGLLLVYTYTYKHNLTLNTTVLVTLLAYIACTKIVNEVYAAPLVPLLLLELKNNPTPQKVRYYKLLWALPFAYALANVPAQHFLINILNSFGLINYTNILNLAEDTNFGLKTLLLSLVGIYYTYLCVSAIPKFAVKEKAYSLDAASENNYEVVT